MPPSLVTLYYIFSHRVFTASSNKSIYVVSMESLQTVARLRGHTRLVSALDADLCRVLSGSADKTVRLWVGEGEGFRQEAVLRGHFVKVRIIVWDR